jgi:redox-sensitive bicupin YhaK (pirin superfamily)
MEVLNQSRSVARVITAHRQREGAGFMVRRPFPTLGLEVVDPFLLLDEMGPVEYRPGEATGAPDHPHRGFETVTYVLEGEMEHEDSAGHRGRLGSGDVQWMTAGRGVIHSEMPSARMRDEGGRVHGFQVWVNLPARDKMMPPRYQELSRTQLTRVQMPDGLAEGVLIAGEVLGQRAVIETRTPIVFQDWRVRPGGHLTVPAPRGMNALAYLFEGTLEVGPEHQPVRDGQMALLGPGDLVELTLPSSAQGAGRALVLGGVPLREPMARYGPFVMNTRDEILQAISDFQEGRMGEIAR